MLKKVLIGFVVFVAVFLGVASMQPEDFSISRSIVVNAPAERVFALVNDFHGWAAWSPWDKLDPTMKRSYEGAASGEGAAYSWVGNDQVGEGRMTITKSAPPELIEIRLEFLKPMQATNLTVFSFKPEGGATNVTWTMSGKNNLMAKAFHLVMNMEKLVGPDFERGLAQMKAAAEGAQK